MQEGVQISKTTNSLSPEYYGWEVTGAPARVNLRLGVVAEISRRFQQHQPSRPDHSILGLLIGHVAPSRVITIDGFQRIDSGGDQEELQGALSRWAAKSDPNCFVVGYCRAEVKDSFSLSNDDMSLLRSHFWRLLSVVMLVKSSVTGVPAAGFFFAELGEARSRFCLSRFPLDWSQLVGQVRGPFA